MYVQSLFLRFDLSTVCTATFFSSCTAMILEHGLSRVIVGWPLINLVRVACSCCSFAAAAPRNQYAGPVVGAVVAAVAAAVGGAQGSEDG